MLQRFNASTLQRFNASTDRTYIVDGIEEFGFAGDNGLKGLQRVSIKWDDEFTPFNVKASCKDWLDSGSNTYGVYMIDGWTLVSSASSDNKNHYGSTVNTNLASSGALITLDYAGRKFNVSFTQYLLNSGEGVFKDQVDNKRFTSFVKIDNNNTFSFNDGDTAPYRIWVSYAYQQWWL